MKTFSDFATEEKYILGYASQNANTATEVTELIEEADFNNPIHAEVFSAIKKALATLNEVSPVTICEHLPEDVGTNYDIEKYIKDYTDNCKDTIVSLCRFLRDRRVRNNLHKLATKVIDLAYSDTTTGVELIHRLETALVRVSQQAKITEIAHTQPSEVITQAKEYLHKMKLGQDIGIPTGIEHLRTKLLRGGYALGELTVIGAVRSMGKTALSLQSFYECGQANIPASYINLEMTAQSLFYRMSLRQTNGKLLTAVNANDPEYERQLGQFAAWFRSKPLFIESVTRDKFKVADFSEVNHIVFYVRKMVAQHGVKAVFIDYGNKLKMKGVDKEQRYRALTLIYETLQDLAIECNVAIIVNHQLSQKTEAEGYEPTLADFKESGGVADVADTAILLWGNRLAQDINAKIGKQRHYKPSGMFAVRFDRERQIMQNGYVAEQEFKSAF